MPSFGESQNIISVLILSERGILFLTVSAHELLSGLLHWGISVLILTVTEEYLSSLDCINGTVTLKNRVNFMQCHDACNVL